MLGTVRGERCSPCLLQS